MHNVAEVVEPDVILYNDGFLVQRQEKITKS